MDLKSEQNSFVFRTIHLGLVHKLRHNIKGTGLIVFDDIAEVFFIKRGIKCCMGSLMDVPV